MWCPPAGQTGFSALGDVLAGDTNPSGKTSDTFLKDLTQSVSYNNFGKFEYTNMEDKAAKYTGFTGDEVTAIPGFVNYSEGIYVATSSMRPQRPKVPSITIPWLHSRSVTV